MESVSSVLGYYNILAYVVPGMLYLYVLNEVLRIGELPYVDLKLLGNANVPSAVLAVEIIAIILAAFVISHLLEPIAARILYLTVGRRPRVDSLNRLKRLHSNIKIDFTIDEVDLLHTIIQQRSPDVSRLIEQYQALSIMLRNLAVGLFLLSVLQFTQLLLDGPWYQSILGILTLLMGIVAMSRSNINRMWSYNIIYGAALEYGSNLQEVLDNSAYRQAKPKPVKRNRAKTNLVKANR